MEPPVQRPSRAQYERLRAEIRTVVGSFTGYFGPSRFVELLGDPAGLQCFLTLIRPGSPTSGAVELMFSLLKDALTPMDGVVVVGGVYSEKFRVPDEIDGLATYMGMPEAQVEMLKEVSRATAKVDGVAVQDGYELWLHVMAFSVECAWSVVQIGHKSVLRRLYLWSSRRAAERDLVDEPHTLILSDSRARYCLDFTHSMNWELRRSSVEVLREGLGRLRRVAASYRPREQRSLLEYVPDLQAEENPLTTPVRVNWRVLEGLCKDVPEDFRDLLMRRGVGVATLRFLAICANRLYDVTPTLEDRAVVEARAAPIGDDSEQLCYDLLEAIRYSKLNEMRRTELEARVEGFIDWYFGPRQN
ncbi:MAG: DUF763 domain-containing protein [Nitrososphaerota archaeon]|nr:DUF763 domain-containing protein [Candidatus Calditenuis fumarioli]